MLLTTARDAETDLDAIHWQRFLENLSLVKQRSKAYHSLLPLGRSKTALLMEQSEFSQNLGICVKIE